MSKENHFDDEAPLSKIGIAAMVGILLGGMLGAAGIAVMFFDFHKRTILWCSGSVLIGAALIWVSFEIACRKIAYKDLPGDK